MNYQVIKDYMSKRNSKKHWSKKDIENILNAQETGNWIKVKESKLYNMYGGEYCSLLEAINYSELAKF